MRRTVSANREPAIVNCECGLRKILDNDRVQLHYQLVIVNCQFAERCVWSLVFYLQMVCNISWKLYTIRGIPFGCCAAAPTTT
jgi:hypothetical protein